MTIKSLFSGIKRFVDGDVSFEIRPKETVQRKPSDHQEKTVAQRYAAWHDKFGYKTFKGAYIAISCFIAVFVIAVLLYTVSYLPPYGEAANPVNNEVTERYI